MAKSNIAQRGALYVAQLLFMSIVGASAAQDRPATMPAEDVHSDDGRSITQLIDATLESNRRGNLSERRQILIRLEEITQQRLTLIQAELRNLSVKLYTDGVGVPGRLNLKELELSELVRRKLELQQLCMQAQARYRSLSDLIQQGQGLPNVEDAVTKDPSISLYRQQLDAFDVELRSQAPENSRMASIQKRRDLIAKKVEDKESELRNTLSQMSLQELSQSAKQSQEALDSIGNRINGLNKELGAAGSSIGQYTSLKDQERTLLRRVQQIRDELDVISAVQGESAASATTQPAK